MQKYKVTPEMIAQYDPEKPWNIQSEVFFPGIDPKNTNKAHNKLDSIYNKPVVNATIASNSPTVEKIEGNGDGSQTSTFIVKEMPRTLEDLKRLAEIDEVQWTVERWGVGAWQMGSVNKAEGEPQASNLWRIWAKMVPNRQAQLANRVIENLIDKYSDKAPKYLPQYRHPQSTGLMLEPSLYDSHFGKHGQDRETGQGNYDLKIATNRYNDAVDYFMEFSKNFGDFDQALLVIGHDISNIDTRAGTTTAGTIVETDSRYFTIVERILDCTIRHIMALRERSKEVRVVSVPGNHDELTAQWIVRLLQAHFRHSQEISFDVEPRKRKYHRWGKGCLGMTHGDKGRLADLPLLMIQECHSFYSEIEYPVIRVGHLHNDSKTDKGIPVETSPALCNADSWLADNGYILATKAAKCHIWCRDRGPIVSFPFNPKWT